MALSHIANGHVVDANADWNPQVDFINNLSNDGFYQRWTTNVAIGTGWTLMAPTVAEAGTGTSVATSIFTLASGVWRIDYFLEMQAASGGVAITNGSSPATTTANILVGNTCGLTAGVGEASCGTSVKSTGSTLIAVYAFRSAATTITNSRLTFSRTANS